MRSFVLTVGLCLALPAGAFAQQDSAAANMNSQAPEPPGGDPNEVVVRAPTKKSPEWAQSRAFTGTRFWRLDKGQQEFELWYTNRFRHDGVKDDTLDLWQIEYMVSLIKGVQLDAYVNYQHDKQDGFRIEGVQIETRIAPWDYGSLWGNPALYLELHPQDGGPVRGEARVLLGGEFLTPRLRAALNPFFEQNLDTGNGTKSSFLPEIEMGGSGALAFVAAPTFSIGGELKYAAEQQIAKDPEHPHNFYNVVKLGPAFWTSFLDGHMHLTAAGQFGLTSNSDAFITTLILSYRP